MAGTLSIVSNSVTGQTGSKIINGSIVAANAILAVQDIAFAGAGFVAITAPVGATLAYIEPPVGNLVALTLKGVTGDTGIAISPNQPFVLTFANPLAPPAFGLTSGGAITGVVEVSYM
jgi:hypothetical protein